MINLMNIEQLEQDYKDGKIKREFISTGIKSLDETLGGGITSGITIIAGKPGYGKTTLAFQISSNLKNGGKTVVFYTYEMPAVDFAEKSIKLKKAQGNMVKEAQGNLFMVDAEDLLLKELVKNIEIQAQEYKNLVVVIDYLQIIQTKGIFDIRANVDKCIRDITRVAKKYNIPIILLSSLSRDAYHKRELEMSALKESSTIESSAVTILGIEASENKKEDKNRKCAIRILKNRYKKREDKLIHLEFQAEDAYFREEETVYCI